jgi:two-component system, OmpR family, response regulator
MKKALIVDDTKNIRALLSTCLEINGFEVTSARDGFEAIKVFDTLTFDIAFIDIKLPELSGTEVLRRIRLKGINVPVVIMTAFASVKNAVECTKLGAVAYLQKPFTADRIKLVLHEMENVTALFDINSYLSNCKDLISSNQYEKAYSMLKAALAKDPLSSEVYRLLGLLYQSQDNKILAEKFYNISRVLK